MGLISNFQRPTPRILTLLDYYLPGYKAGGPLRTVANMVEHLSDDFEFWIVTRDRDLGSPTPYDNVAINQWNEVGKAKVFYASPSQFSLIGLKNIINNTDYDVLYLNSFFSPNLTTTSLLLNRLGLVKAKSIVIAPRGEFSPAALQLKIAKKKLYIVIAKALRLYGGLLWHASSEKEEKLIRKKMGAIAKDVFIAPDLLSLSPEAPQKSSRLVELRSRNNHLQVIFLSRISPMKNLDYLLRQLKRVQVPINLSIFGPLEDSEYWAECERLIGELPVNVVAQYRGEASPDQVSKLFAQHDVFFLPTRGENFGHVIFESLAAGTAVVLSDRTPWQPDENGAVEIIPLDASEAWIFSLERWAQRSKEELVKCRENALNYACRYLAKSPALEQNRALFYCAYNRTVAPQQNTIP